MGVTVDYQLYSGTKTSSSNAGDIAMPQPIVYQLQMQIDRVENGRKVAEERANQNEHLLNQKLVEMAQLQTVLRHQNKVCSDSQPQVTSSV